MNKIDISVLLAVKNGAAFIKESIDSVLQQEYSSFELLISDDYSTDDTIAIINSFADKRITLFKQSRSLGQFGNFNFLLLQAKGKFVHFWSHDDVMHPNCLSITIDFFIKNPSIGLSYCSCDYIDENGKVTQKWVYDGTPKLLDQKLYATYSLTYGCLAGSISQVAVNRKKIGYNQIFNDNLKHSGDFEFWTRISEKSDIGFISENLASIRTHQDQVTNSIRSLYASVSEGIPIINNLFLRLNISPSNTRYIKRQLILVHYFHRVIVLIRHREFRLFVKGIGLLNKEDNLFNLLIAWLRFYLRDKNAFLEHRKKLTSLLFD